MERRGRVETKSREYSWKAFGWNQKQLVYEPMHLQQELRKIDWKNIKTVLDFQSNKAGYIPQLTFLLKITKNAG